MVAVFSQILNMSMTGSIVILLVMLARILLKRSPKIFSYALWSVVLFRLLCPVSFSAPVSILSGLQPEATAVSDAVSVVSYLPDTVDFSADFVAMPMEENTAVSLESAELYTRLVMTPMHMASLGWVTVALAMLLYSFVQYINLRIRLIGAVKRGKV